MKIGDIVKFKDHREEGDEQLRFKILELNEDRCKVEMITTMPLKPTFVYFTNSLEKSLCINAIINIGEKHGTINGEIMENKEIQKIVNNQLKNGMASLIIDNENTLMYKLFS